MIGSKSTLSLIWSAFSVDKSDSPLEIDSESVKLMDMSVVLNVAAVIDTSTFYIYSGVFSSGTDVLTFSVSFGNIFTVT